MERIPSNGHFASAPRDWLYAMRSSWHEQERVDMIVRMLFDARFLRMNTTLTMTRTGRRRWVERILFVARLIRLHAPCSSRHEQGRRGLVPKILLDGQIAWHRNRVVRVPCGSYQPRWQDCTSPAERTRGRHSTVVADPRPDPGLNPSTT